MNVTKPARAVCQILARPSCSCPTSTTAAITRRQARVPEQQQQRCLTTYSSRFPHRTSTHTSSQHSRRPFHSTNSPQQKAKDPYKVLGVDKAAEASAIKKAYYALAKQYHPDTNKDPKARELFVDAQQAYEILSDPKKKETYDQYGSAAFDASGGFNPGAAGPGAGGPFSGFGGFGGFSGGGAQGFNGQDFSFEDLFGAFGGGGGARGGRRRQNVEEVAVGENIEVQTTISFLDAAHGAEKTIRITPLSTCNTCTGSGLKPGTKKGECPRCSGTGTRIHNVQGGFQMASTCTTCSGTGIAIPKGSECKTCDGAGVTRETKSVRVDIPPGVEDGMRLRITNEGDAPVLPTGMSAARMHKGDLYVHIRVQAHPSFGRDGADVLYTAQIPMTTAVLGGRIKVPTLDGEIELNVPTGTMTGEKFTMTGRGMRKIGGRKNATGDMKVEFKVMLPKSLSASQRTLLELLADDLEDKSAKRVMNVGNLMNQPSSSSANTTPPHPDKNENEGFLKRVLHKFTAPDTPDDSTKPIEDSTKSEDDKKSASGSG